MKTMILLALFAVLTGCSHQDVKTGKVDSTGGRKVASDPLVTNPYISNSDLTLGECLCTTNQKVTNPGYCSNVTVGEGYCLSNPNVTNKSHCTGATIGEGLCTIFRNGGVNNRYFCEGATEGEGYCLSKHHDRGYCQGMSVEQGLAIYYAGGDHIRYDRCLSELSIKN